MEKIMDVKGCITAREVKNYVNDNNISKDDIVTIIYREGQFLIFYYKNISNGR